MCLTYSTDVQIVCNKMRTGSSCYSDCELQQLYRFVVVYRNLKFIRKSCDYTTLQVGITPNSVSEVFVSTSLSLLQLVVSPRIKCEID